MSEDLTASFELMLQEASLDTAVCFPNIILPVFHRPTAFYPHYADLEKLVKSGGFYCLFFVPVP